MRCTAPATGPFRFGARCTDSNTVRGAELRQTRERLSSAARKGPRGPAAGADPRSGCAESLIAHHMRCTAPATGPFRFGARCTDSNTVRGAELRQTRERLSSAARKGPRGPAAGADPRSGCAESLIAHHMRCTAPATGPFRFGARCTDSNTVRGAELRQTREHTAQLENSLGVLIKNDRYTYYFC